MNTSDEHERLIATGLALHEARQYTDALLLFRQALKETPNCAAAQYNVANTLYMLGEYGEASTILKKLIATDNEIFLNGCPFEEDPEPFKLDALYLLFLATLYESGSWKAAYPYAVEHLVARRGEVESVFSDEHVVDEIALLQKQWDTDSA